MQLLIISRHTSYMPPKPANKTNPIKPNLSSAPIEDLNDLRKEPTHTYISRRQSCKTNPISQWATFMTRIQIHLYSCINCAKQSQFCPEAHGSRSSQRPRQRTDTHTSQRSLKCAKQTQFYPGLRPRASSTWQRTDAYTYNENLEHTKGCAEPCKTKPISQSLKTT